MSRIEPIRPSRALVRVVREAAGDDAQRPADEQAAERPAARNRPSTQLRPALGDAAAAATFGVHMVSGGPPRGLKADLGVRRQWHEAYRTAAEIGGETRECAKL